MLLNVLLLQLLEAMRKLQEVDARTGLNCFEIVVCKVQEVDQSVCPSTELIVSASSVLQQGGCYLLTLHTLREAAHTLRDM